MKTFTTIEAITLPDEIWKPVHFADGYKVSNKGRLFSYRHYRNKRIEFDPEKGRLLTLYIRPNKRRKNHRGYMIVGLYKGNKQHFYPIHLVVMRCFVGDCPEGMECRHLDDNPHNNDIENLKYGTPKENCEDRDRNGRTAVGERASKAKLKDDEVRTIRYLYEIGSYSHRSLGKIFGVKHTTIGCILRGESWRSVK